MIRLFYVSTATQHFDDRDLRILTEAAAGRNGRLGLTGALAFNGTNFAQVLEGEEGAVITLMNAIRADERHGGVIEISRRPVTKRRWDGWSMRLVEGLAFDELLESMASD